MSGYTPVEAMYDFQFGFRTGTNIKGELAPLKLRSTIANANSNINDKSCQGAYFALYANADGDRDPKTGQCTLISTQYKLRAIPAFVVDAQTQSANVNLDAH